MLLHEGAKIFVRTLIRVSPILKPAEKAAAVTGEDEIAIAVPVHVDKVAVMSACYVVLVVGDIELVQRVPTVRSLIPAEVARLIAFTRTDEVDFSVLVEVACEGFGEVGVDHEVSSPWYTNIVATSGMFVPTDALASVLCRDRSLSPSHSRSTRSTGWRDLQGSETNGCRCSAADSPVR